MSDNPFILIPLPILRDLIVDKATIENIFNFGIYFTAKKIIVSDYDARREFSYCIRKSPEEISDKLRERYYEIYFPYSANSKLDLEHVKEMKQVKAFCDWNPDFHDSLREWSKVRIVHKTLQLDTKNVEHIIQQVESCSQNYDFNNCPLILVNAKVMMNLYEKRNNMKSDTRAMWAMYFGILSIIGKKEYAQTTSSMIKCRMFGAKNKEELNSLLRNPALKKAYDRYTSKYQYHKLLNIIQDRNLITEIGLNRRTYVSYKLKSIDELVDAISDKKNEEKCSTLRNEEKARAKARFLSITRRNIR